MISRNYLIFYGILLSYFFAFSDLYMLSLNLYTSGFETSTLSFIKVFKDVYYILILYFVLIKINNNQFVFIFVILLVILPSLAYTVLGNGLLTVLFGLRWILPFVVGGSLLFSDYREKFSTKNAYFILSFMFFNIAIQLLQTYLFTNHRYFSEELGVLRSPGMFFLPSASSFIMCFSYLYIKKCHINKLVSTSLCNYSLFIFSYSTFLADSASVIGIVIICIMFHFKILKSNIKGFLISFLLVIISILTIVNFSPRGMDILNRSLLARIDLFLNNLPNFNVVSNNFGLATSAGIQLSDFNGYITLESSLSTIFYNAGYLSGFVLMFFYILFLYVAFLRNKVSQNVVPCLLLCASSFITLNSFEFFPLGALIFVGIRNY